jgi:hypothetical protein
MCLDVCMRALLPTTLPQARLTADLCRPQTGSEVTLLVSPWCPGCYSSMLSCMRIPADAHPCCVKSDGVRWDLTLLGPRYRIERSSISTHTAQQ